MTDYPRPALTVDCVIFRGDEVLLIRRGKEPFAGRWALPGGYVNEGETTIRAAARELFEETGITVEKLRLVGVFSEPGRDPRGWVVSVAYWADVPRDTLVNAGDDASEAAWTSLDGVKNLAFDHDRILDDATALSGDGWPKMDAARPW